MKPADQLQQIIETIKELPEGTEFEFLITYKDTFVRGGTYGREWTRLEFPLKETQEHDS